MQPTATGITRTQRRLLSMCKVDYTLEKILRFVEGEEKLRMPQCPLHEVFHIFARFVGTLNTIPYREALPSASILYGHSCRCPVTQLVGQ